MQNLKFLAEELERLRAQAEKYRNSAGSMPNRAAYYQGQQAAFYAAFCMVEAAMNEEEEEYLTPAEIATSDFADYVHFMKQCRP